jgi:hypothetical protein
VRDNPRAEIEEAGKHTGQTRHGADRPSCKPGLQHQHTRPGQKAMQLLCVGAVLLGFKIVPAQTIDDHVELATVEAFMQLRD